METKKKVLIVDDDKSLSDLYSLKFGNSGYEVGVANDAATAIQKLEAGSQPDVIILDLVMPGENGMDLLEKLRSGNLIGNASVIVLSNLDQKNDLDEEIMKKIDGYFVKADVTPADMVREVGELMRKKEVVSK